MPKIEDCWLSVDDICKHLGVGKSSVYNWKFKKGEVDEWVKAGGAADRDKKDSDE